MGKCKKIATVIRSLITETGHTSLTDYEPLHFPCKRQEFKLYVLFFSLQDFIGPF